MENIINTGKTYLMNNYGRYPICFEKGDGCKVYDKDGKEYIDFLGGVAVNSLGYGHKNLVNAIKNQAEKLIHISNYFWIENQISLGKLLAENSFADKAFFCNSGAEANEAAVKLARKYAYKKYGSHQNHIIAMSGSFHGRTLATLSMTSNKKYQEGFGPCPEGFSFADFNDIESLAKLITENTCAVILEPIQGEGGVTPSDISYLEEVKEICQKNNVLLIFDEVQCGMGRTGNLFAYESYGVTPDIVSLAKGLGSGFPIGAIIATDEVASAFEPGDHGSTFGGNPLACAAALATLNTIIEDGFLKNVCDTSTYFIEKLNELKEKHSIVKTVKGKGLLLGLELKIEGSEIVKKGLEKGILINCTASNVLRFVPPLIINKEEIDFLISALDNILEFYR
ncbi:acetylornithine aminotransferase/acetylornithine/N-succinyldiaminopimelate aminotransferase [Acetoanaerobium pronyense]|uniref:Acetylornithine aminotransferase n=1 Tax=Acetoanaerobium pronyense TaxID=1482736 RepID=A0ABS4KHQ8_9FIRM|nr:acetylornithine transaminase [Acetoanaerobium pronyense]MBP2027326.1 acetylornithine aminotransferase/acetylornithine/N-succinyldiaminopimelate aminotransferase [Acetoanaerobium pronyense]